MERPAPPPEAVLIRLVREAANISVAAAAQAAGMSKARWSQIENGAETREGGYRPVVGSRRTIAHMAATVGVDPDRLARHRPDAAQVLREIERRPQLVLLKVPSAEFQDPLQDAERDGRPVFDDPEDQAVSDEAWERSAEPDPQARRGMVAFAVGMARMRRRQHHFAERQQLRA